MTISSRKPLSPRESAKLISSKSRDIIVCNEGVQQASQVIFECLKSRKYSFKVWKEHELHPKNMTTETVDWIFVVDTLNFCFWTEEGEEPWLVRFEGKDYTGYWGLCAAINRALKVGKNSFEFLLCNAIFVIKITSSSIVIGLKIPP